MTVFIVKGWNRGFSWLHFGCTSFRTKRGHFSFLQEESSLPLISRVVNAQGPISGTMVLLSQLSNLRDRTPKPWVCGTFCDYDAWRGTPCSLMTFYPKSNRVQVIWAVSGDAESCIFIFFYFFSDQRTKKKRRDTKKNYSRAKWFGCLLFVCLIATE